MRGWTLLALFVGCDAVFDLEHVTPIDAPATIDHDGDGVFEGDNCPLIANADQLDDDDDMIGNMCDPHPGQNDVIIDQELFRGPTSMWTETGTWTKAEGAWTSPDPTIGGAIAFPIRQLYRPALQVGFTIKAYDPSIDLHQLELHFDDSAVADCSVRNDTNAGAMSQLVMHVGTTMYVSRAITPDFVTETHYVATYARALMSTCTILNQPVSRPDTAELFTSAPTLTVARMQVTIDHVTLYQVMQ